LKETAVTLRDKAHDRGSQAEDPPLFANLLPPVLGLIGIGVLACAVWAWGLNDNYSGEALLNCSAITNGPARLACYDQLAMPHQPAKGALAPVQTYPPQEFK
jgi:hypothetical protein